MPRFAITLEEIPARIADEPGRGRVSLQSVVDGRFTPAESVEVLNPWSEPVGVSRMVMLEQVVGTTTPKEGEMIDYIPHWLIVQADA